MKEKVESYGIVGATVVVVRPMSDTELEEQGWEADRIDGRPDCIVLSTGTKVFASRDPEGNGPGALFGMTKGGQDIYVIDGVK